jgi:hypothetical protein
MSELAVHPVAALFPMLAEDELDELAASIKANGLLQPIVLDKDGAILDGRHRLKACGKAGVKPRFETYKGDDPYGAALEANKHRRYMRPSALQLITEGTRRLKKGYLALSKKDGPTRKTLNRS